MKKYLLLLLLGILLVLVAAWWLYARRSAPPEVPFARVKRETLVSTLSTNGKAEPIEWVSVRTQRSGLLARVPVHPGQHVGRGALLAEMDATDAKAELASAEARIREAQAELQVLERGGRPADLAQIESSLASSRLELQSAQEDLEALGRLSQKQAATKQEVTEAAQRVEKARLAIQALQKKRSTLVSEEDKTVAQAKLQEAETTAELARRRILEALIRAPMDGVIYELEARAGAYLNPGDLVAKVGQTGKVRVHVYVDEPELGRVSEGVPVTITWDAFQGRQWKGVVERMPSEIVSLETRQVGEVVCIIDNPGGEILPGTNVNAEIRSAVVPNALTIPREALRREANQDGVYVLEGDRISWRNIRLGISSATRAQILEGLAQEDSVALPTDRTLTKGLVVEPVYPG